MCSRNLEKIGQQKYVIDLPQWSAKQLMLISYCTVIVFAAIIGKKLFLFNM